MGDGSWYIGWKDKGGEEITDQEFKTNVITAIERDINNRQRLLDNIKKSIL